MVDVNVNFVLEQDEPINANFIIEPDVTYTADIVMSSSSSFHNDLYNRDLPDQHPISAITGLENSLDSKVDKTDEIEKVYGTDENGDQTTYDLDSFGKVDDVQVDGISIVENKIADLGTMALESLNDYSTTAVADTLYADISYEGTIDNHIADKNNPHSVTKAQVGLGNCDNTSDLDKPISTATQTALDGKQAIISDLSTIRTNAEHGESAYNTISGYGDIVTHDTSEFATSAQGTLADTALQPNDDISELVNDVGYITSASLPTNYVTTDTAQTIGVQKAFSQPLVVADGVGVASGTIISNKKILQKNSGGVEVGNSTEDIKLVGKSTTTNPTYNGNDLALKSDIPTMTAGTGIDITSNTLSVTDPTLVNNGTGTKALAVGKTSQSTAEGGVAVGYGARANSTYGTAVGYESRANNTNTTAIGKQATASNARAIAIGSGAEANADDAIAIKGINNTANTFQVYTYNMLDMSTGLIPDARINSSTYATVTYVNDQVSTNTAYFDGSWNTYADIPTSVAGFTSENLPEPTNNNYLVVLEDETQDGGTWRYKYVDDGQAYNKNKWEVEYEVNETPFTQSQLDAINSGVTSSDVALAQSALQSGDNISELVNNSGYITSSDLPTVDQVYNSSSTNAQSGTAVAGALTSKLSLTNGSAVTVTAEGFTLNTGEGNYNVICDGTSAFSFNYGTGNVGILDEKLRFYSYDDELTIAADENTVNFDIGYGKELQYNGSEIATVSQIPTVNDATLTIQKNGTNVQTFTANASSNVTANITVPTDTGDLTNNAGFITSSDLPTNYVTTDTAQDITGTKTFIGQKKIAFKQSGSSDKLGFTLYNNSGTEKGYLEYNPSNLVDNVPLMTLGNYTSTSIGLTHIGFRKYDSNSGGAYNLLAPLVSDAKTPFSLTTTYTNFYLPLGYTDGNTTVTTAKSGLVDISSFGYTKNVGTVTSVNNTSPDSNGNVSISIPAAQVNSDWNANSGVAEILNKPTLATVATSGSYNDLTNKPTIPSQLTMTYTALTETLTWS